MGLLPENSLLPVTANNKMLAQALKARQQPRTQLTGQGLLDTAAIGLGPVPVIGDALGLAADASRFYNEPESRTPLNFGLAALGLIPFVPPLVSAGLGKFAQSQGKTLTAPSMTGPARNQAGAIVYHGSPHKFDQFDAAHIGKGEGAQAYGHGLYFAEAQDVAKSYVPRDMKYEEKLLKMYQQAERSQNYDAMEVLESAMMHKTPKELMEQYPNQAGLVGKIKNIPYNAGALYKVDLPDEAIAKMLDWDKPLSQQAPEVQKALRGYVDGLPSPQNVSPEWAASGKKFDPLSGDPTGAEIYGRIAGMPKGHAQFGLDRGNQVAASDALQKTGIPGLRYLDGGSRGAGAGTSNYVVFPGNEGLLKILSRE